MIVLNEVVLERFNGQLATCKPFDEVVVHMFVPDWSDVVSVQDILDEVTTVLSVWSFMRER